MLSALLVLIVTAAFAAALGSLPRLAPHARLAGALGTALALSISILRVGLPAGNTSVPVQWPSTLLWLGETLFSVDVLSVYAGTWVLALGFLSVLRLGAGSTEETAARTARVVLVLALLYGLTYTINLIAFGGIVLVLAVGAAMLATPVEDGAGRVGSYQQAVALADAALCVLVAALIIGRTTGGSYSLQGLSLAALSVWPLILTGAFAAIWLGAAPLTGWSAGREVGIPAAVIQGLVVGTPAVLLLLRMQALVSAQGAVGSIPATWPAFMSALAWIGGATALVAGAGTVVWAGSERWHSMSASYWMGLMLLGLGLDTPDSRLAALAIFASYGAARLTLALASGQTRAAQAARTVAGLSLAGVPLLPGFLGLWLLAGVLAGSQRPAAVLILLGAALMSAAGTALHLGRRSSTLDNEAIGGSIYARLGPAAAVLLLIAGVLPAFWLPALDRVVGFAGGQPTLSNTTPLLFGYEGMMLTLLLPAALLVAGIAWLVGAWARSGAAPAGLLLPTAAARLQARQPASERFDGVMSSAPGPVWWLSLAWLEAGISGFGATLWRLSAGAGSLAGRLEGRYYLPLTVIATLLILLAMTR